MGNIERRLSRCELTWDPKQEQFAGDAGANDSCARKPRSAAYDPARVMKNARLSFRQGGE